MSRLFDNWFNFEGFNPWKLRTPGDYFYFLLIIAIGVAALAVATKVLAKRRTHDIAVQRTAKRLKKLGGRGAECYCGKTVRTKKADYPCDLICVAQDKVYIVRVYHFGLEVYGGRQEPLWKFRYYKEEVTEQNPLPALEERAVALSQLFVKAGVRNVDVEPLIVFADNFGTTKFYLPGAERLAVSIGFLKKWRKDRPLGRKGGYDIEEVKKALEASFV